MFSTGTAARIWEYTLLPSRVGPRRKTSGNTDCRRQKTHFRVGDRAAGYGIDWRYLPAPWHPAVALLRVPGRGESLGVKVPFWQYQLLAGHLRSGSAMVSTATCGYPPEVGGGGSWRQSPGPTNRNLTSGRRTRATQPEAASGSRGFLKVFCSVPAGRNHRPRYRIPATEILRRSGLCRPGHRVFSLSFL
jgi:hypothetical protein